MNNPWKFECPKGWEILQPWGDGYALQKGALRAIVDCEQKSDGRHWIHVSVSRKSCMEGDGRILPEFSEILPEIGVSI